MNERAILERETRIKYKKAVSARKCLQPNRQHREEQVHKVWSFLRENAKVVHSMTMPYKPHEGKVWLKHVSDVDMNAYKRIDKRQVSSNFLSELPQDTQLYDPTVDGTGAHHALFALRGKHRGEARAMNALPEDCGWSLMDGPCPQVEVDNTELESLACLDKDGLRLDELHYGHCDDAVLRAKYDGSDATWVKEAPDWSRQTHLCFAPCQRADDKHWRREARATTLGIAFSNLGLASDISSKDIYAWFCSLPVLARGGRKRRTGRGKQGKGKGDQTWQNHEWQQMGAVWHEWWS